MTKKTKIFLTRLQYALAIGGLIFIPIDGTFRPSIILFSIATLVSSYLVLVKEKENELDTHVALSLFTKEMI